MTIGNFPRTSAAQHAAVDVGRSLDVVLALVGLIAFGPLLLVIAAAICLWDGGPCLYLHERVGYRGLTFKCFKFRTMAVDAQEKLAALLESSPEARREWAASQKLRNDPRITPIGQFLRKSSLDEFPQLFNVMLGQMNLVGPRPIVASEVGHYGDVFQLYCAVRPGITGLWQISGRSDTTYAERVALDAEYVCTRSFARDLEILVKTLPAVLFRRGSY